MRVAVVPGSFDPITKGHVSLVSRACALFDHVYVVAMINAEKQYMFSLEERRAFMEDALCHIKNVTVDSSGDMLYKYARDKGACAIVKGIRRAEDTAYEIWQAEYNRKMNPQAETVLLLAGDGMEGISSTYVRRLAEDGRDVGGLVTEKVRKALLRKVKKENIYGRHTD